VTKVRKKSISKTNCRSALITLTPLILLALFTVVAHTVQAQTYTVLYEFKGVPDGYAPSCSDVAALSKRQRKVYGSWIGRCRTAESCRAEPCS
jgi:hypothetical protein